MNDLGIFHLVAAVLLACAVAGAFARKARQPVIVAFIAVVLGPVLGLMDPGEEAIELLAHGIALLLFIVGLELDLRLIKRVGPVALATGLGQVAFTSGVGFFITLVLGFDHLHDDDRRRERQRHRDVDRVDHTNGSTLLHGLQEIGYGGKVALTAHAHDNAVVLTDEGADMILDPAEKAAVETIRRLGLQSTT